MEYLKKDKEFAEYYTLFSVMFNIGARVGEVCALTWDCVDWSYSRLTIEK